MNSSDDEFFPVQDTAVMDALLASRITSNRFVIVGRVLKLWMANDPVIQNMTDTWWAFLKHASINRWCIQWVRDCVIPFLRHLIFVFLSCHFGAVKFFLKNIFFQTIRHMDDLNSQFSSFCKILIIKCIRGYGSDWKRVVNSTQQNFSPILPTRTPRLNYPVAFILAKPWIELSHGIHPAHLEIEQL